MRRSHRVLAAAAALTLCSQGVRAQALQLRTTLLDGREITVIEKFKFMGDLRLRHEAINRKSAGRAARQRQRLRVRLGTELDLPHDLTVGLTLASGVGSQVSQNTSFDNLAAQKGIYLDRAFLRWAPALSDEAKAHLTGGKMKNPIWRVCSSDAVWDGDVNPEGAAQGIEWPLPWLGGTYFVNLLQAPLDEDSDSEADQWLFAQQAGAEYALPFDSRLRIAVAYYEWVNERMSTFGQIETNDGNRRDAAGVLLNDFGVWELTGQLSARLAEVPLRLQGTYINNTAASGMYVPKENQGYQAGAIAGKAKKARSWEAAYFHKYLESDATVADLADSDFGEGGTNRKGHILWAAYCPWDWMHLRAKFFHTMSISGALGPGEHDVNHVQFDVTVKF